MHKTKFLMTITLLTVFLLSACGAGKADETPTPGLEQIQTAAVQTFEAALTQTAIAQPTAAPTTTPMPTNTFLPTVAFSTLAVTNTPLVVTSCNKLVYIKDVTIPDNTAVNPGQSFTKTWQVQNSGTCAWAVGFKFSLVGGDAMGGQTITLSQAVNPGATYEISVPMTAPTNKTGKITGTWRMSDAAGAYFGDGLTVVVVVGGTTATPTATATTAGYP